MKTFIFRIIMATIRSMFSKNGFYYPIDLFSSGGFEKELNKTICLQNKLKKSTHNELKIMKQFYSILREMLDSGIHAIFSFIESLT